MTKEGYEILIRENLTSFIQNSPGNWIAMQDNASTHNSALCTLAMRDADIKLVKIFTSLQIFLLLPN